VVPKRERVVRVAGSWKPDSYAPDEITKDIWKSKPRYDSQTTNVRDQAVLPALVTLATHSGYNDLAAAMIVSGYPALQAANALASLPLNNEHVIAAVAHLAAKHPDLAVMPASEIWRPYTLREAVGRDHQDLTFGQLADALRTRPITPDDEAESQAA
jgi:hypothetical protein